MLRLIVLAIVLLSSGLLAGCAGNSDAYLLRPTKNAKLYIYKYKGNSVLECDLLPEDIDSINSILSGRQLKWKNNYTTWSPEYIIRTQQHKTKLLIQDSILNFEEGDTISVYCENSEVCAKIKMFLNKISKERNHVLVD
jgi:hypothetical protein